LVSLVTLIAFWKKKDSQTPEPERIIPLPNLSASTLETPRSTSLEAVNRARETLKVLRLERQILGSAVTTIYESQTKGIITEAERDRLLEKYKVDLKRLEKAINENQDVVDLYDLEVERENVIKNYKARLAEIDAKLKDLKSGSPSRSENPMRLTQGQTEKKISGESREGQPIQDPQGKQKEDEPVTDAEKRIDKIREEILQAMDRLEQIETEG
jgi:hypothetical protein